MKSSMVASLTVTVYQWGLLSINLTFLYNHRWLEGTEIIYFSVSFFEFLTKTFLQDRCKSQMYLKKNDLNGSIANGNFKSGTKWNCIRLPIILQRNPVDSKFPKSEKRSRNQNIRDVYTLIRPKRSVSQSLVLILSECCKYKLLEISRLLSHADLHAIELSRTFHQVTHLLCNTIKIVLM